MDTVEITRWRTRVREVHDTVNLVREVVVTQVDTLYAFRPMLGIVGLNTQGQEWGDSLNILGFEIWGDTSSIHRRDWRTTHFMAGPIRTVVLSDTLPPLVEHWPMPGKPCGTWCKLKAGLLGAAIGAGSASVVCAAK